MHRVTPLSRQVTPHACWTCLRVTVAGHASHTGRRLLSLFNDGSKRGFTTAWFAQARNESSSRHYTGSEDAHGVSGNAPITHRPSWSSSAPSAGWSTSSPAASWGSSQTGGSAQHNQGSSGQSLVQKAKEHLPGGSSEHANNSTIDGSSSSLMEKAEAHLPGSNSSGQDITGQGQRTMDRPDIPVVCNGDIVKADSSIQLCYDVWQAHLCQLYPNYVSYLFYSVCTFLCL